MRSLVVMKGMSCPALGLRTRRGSVIHQGPLKRGGELHLPLKDTIKTFRKPREGSGEEGIHTENRALETVLRKAGGGRRDEIQGAAFPVERAATGKCCLETDFIKHRHEFRAEFALQILPLDLKRRKTNWLIKVIFS